MNKKIDYCGICGKNIYSYKHGGICKECEPEWKRRNEHRYLARRKQND